ncbi:MAG: hypothetical protein ACRCX2_00795, partial [Paraclostridium sp.]
MNYYFNFFNDTKKEYFKADRNNSNIKTNLSNFNLKIYYNETGVRPDKVTDFKLVLERENNGVFYHYKKLDALLDSYEMTLNFTNCKLDSNEFSNDKFKIYLMLYENGIPVYSGENSAIFVTLKTKGDEFYIDVNNTKKIDDVFEIQNSSEVLTEIDLTIKTYDQATSNNLLYYCNISHEETIKMGTYEVLGVNEKNVKVAITPTTFLNNETYIHIAIKDIFGNVNYKKYKLLALGNNFSSFEIFSDDIIIGDLDGAIDLYIDFRNVAAITPVITYKENNTEVKEVAVEQIGTYNLEGGRLSFIPSEYFNFKSIMEYKNVAYLSFYLNGNKELETKSVALLYDDKSPVVKISNLDENNYGLTRNDSDYFKINGSFMEDNLFFIGRESKKCDFLEMQHTLIISSTKELVYAEFTTSSGVERVNLQKYGDAYVCQSLSESFLVYDDKGVQATHDSFINDYASNGTKKLFLVFEKEKMSNYERNIIDNQGGLKLKGPASLESTGQKFIDFQRYFIIDVTFPQGKVGKFSFDVGIEGFEYSFLKHCLKNNVSSEISDIKELEIGFVSTRIVSINTTSDISVIKFNDLKVTGEYNFFKLNEISFKPLSLMENEFFSTSENVSFFDDYLNAKNYENIHTMPILRIDNNVNVDYKNFRLSKSSMLTDGVDNNYGFEMDCPISDGINNFILNFQDITGKESLTSFTIEKNHKDVEFTIDKQSMKGSEIVDNNFGYTLTNNKDKSFIKIIVNNETKKQKEKERYIITKSGDKVLKHKIVNDKGVSICTFSLDNAHGGVTHSVFYETLDDKKFDLLLVKKDDLTLSVESEFISGSNNYFLEFEKDPFAKIDLDYNNKDKFICSLNDNFVEIIRINNDNFMEEIELSLKAYDHNGNFEIKTKTIKGVFYNDSILVGYEIQKNFLDNGQLIYPMFNLEIKTYSRDVIDYISYHDNYEIDVFRRKKIAIYDSEKEVYIIEGIVAPISEVALTINFHLKNNDLIIRREIFETDKIMLKTETNEFLTSCNKIDNELEFNIRSSTGKTELLELSIIANDKVVSNFENVTFENEFDNKTFKLNIDGYSNYNLFYIRFVTKRGKVIYSKMIEYNFSRTNIKFKNFIDDDLLIVDKNDAKTLNISFKEKTGKLKLEITNTYEITKDIEIFDGVNILEDFENGIYNMKTFYIDSNNRKQLSKYKMQVFDKYGDHIELENRAFETIKKVCNFTIRNNSLIPNDKLSSFISLYINGNFVKNYFPKYVNGKMEFNFEKREGKVDIFYQDKYCSLKLSSFEHRESISSNPKVYNIGTVNNEMFTKDGNVIRMVEFVDLLFQTKNVDNIKIVSKKFGRISERRVSDNFRTVISKIHMPCDVYFYNKDGKKLFEEPLMITEYEKIIYSFKIKNTENPRGNKPTRLTLDLNKYVLKRNISKLNIKFKHENNHVMYNTFKSIAIMQQCKWWLELDKGRRNEIIKEINNKAYSELNRVNGSNVSVEEIK